MPNPPPNNSDYRDRLMRFFQHYVPQKVPMVDVMLEKYRGRETEMFAALVQKYGPEVESGSVLLPNTTARTSPRPTAVVSSVNATSTPPNDTNYRERLTRFYQHYAPHKLATIDSTLATFCGREVAMFAALVQKYGPEPASTTPVVGASSGSTTTTARTSPRPTAVVSSVQNATSTPPNDTNYRERLTRFYQHYAPDKLSTVDVALEKFRGREMEMFALLVQKYGPEEPVALSNTHPTLPSVVNTSVTSDTNYRDRLVRFYQHYAPDKLSTVDVVLEKYRGREMEMFALLVQKYGPEPVSTTPVVGALSGRTTTTARTSPRPTAVVSSVQNATSTPPNDNNYRERLTRIYQHYAPDKLSSVELALERYRGQEVELFALLVQKYGPEPASTTPVNATTTPANNNFRERLIRYYQHYAPHKLSSVELALEKYRGQEVELFAALVQKYGPEESVPKDGTTGVEPANTRRPYPLAAQSLMERYYLRWYARTTHMNVSDAQFASIERKIDAFRIAVEGKFQQGSHHSSEAPSSSSSAAMGPVLCSAGSASTNGGSLSIVLGSTSAGGGPSTSASSASTRSDAFRDRLIRFYETYEPAKLRDADLILYKYKGKEDELFDVLVRKYGPEPPPTQGVKDEGPQQKGSALPQLGVLLKAPLFSPVPFVPPPLRTHRDRLTRFFEFHNPSKLEQVDTILAQYAGNEEELFKKLEQKYGPAPPSPSDFFIAPL